MRAPNGDDHHTGRSLRDSKWNLDHFEGLSDEQKSDLETDNEVTYFMNWNDVVCNFETLYLTQAPFGKAQTFIEMEGDNLYRFEVSSEKEFFVTVNLNHVPEQAYSNVRLFLYQLCDEEAFKADRNQGIIFCDYATGVGKRDTTIRWKHKNG
jgi:hypothetical protein